MHAEGCYLERRQRPAVLIATPFLGGTTTRPLLAELRRDPATRAVPLVG